MQVFLNHEKSYCGLVQLREQNSRKILARKGLKFLKCSRGSMRKYPKELKKEPLANWLTKHGSKSTHKKTI